MTLLRSFGRRWIGAVGELVDLITDLGLPPAHLAPPVVLDCCLLFGIAVLTRLAPLLSSGLLRAEVVETQPASSVGHDAAPAGLAQDPDVLHPLDQMTPARTRPTRGSAGVEPLQALRVLSYRQALGAERANAHTLRDVCQLAVAACTAAEQHLPSAAIPLGRVNRAATLDALDHAREQWRGLADQLYPRIHGLSRGPRLHHDAATALADACATNQAVTRAVLAALPRLAREAAPPSPGSATTANWSPHDAPPVR